ncbi:MAG: acylphosphatase [Bacillota bacterium]
MEKHLCIYLEGIVQGVGMRYYVNDLAVKMGLRGYVQNTPDRRVKCVVQGEAKKLELFIAALKNAPRGRVTNVVVEPYTSTEKFSDFNIRF